jgi:acylphosphatase
MVNISAHVIVSGHVQGVFYRDTTQRQANAHGVTGWVRNLPDGRVEALFEGDEKAVRRMIDWCWRGPPNAYVTNVDASIEPYRGLFTTFNVRW